MSSNSERVAIRIKGVVQGVGFRPFIFNLAREYGLNGWVTNDSAGVLLEVEGAVGTVEDFLRAIPRRVPRLARIDAVEHWGVAVTAEEGFYIKETDRTERVQTLISPDMAVCDDCLLEMLNPNDRRYLYPFINCTNCGPRFTIIEEMPYDRPFTTMRDFQMCLDCEKEYDDPTNRRFHAQPNACPTCGPKVWLLNADGSEIELGETGDPVWARPVKELRRRLGAGQIAGVKGLGGYHLVADAKNQDAVLTLRNRKHRPDKPFAVMMPTLDVVRQFCHVSIEEERLLLSPASPIVLLEWKGKGRDGIAIEVAPKESRLGVMLPYTPLHHLLFDEELQVLIMTSGNMSGEPIIYLDEEAIGRLGKIVDCFLVHNREIVRPCDDSVQRVDGEPLMLRRSRGYAPMPVLLKGTLREELPSVLASGGELKNTFALGRNGQVFLSQHIGDLKTRNSLHHYRKMIGEMQHLLEIEPEVVAYDLHPGYQSSRYLLDKYAGKKLVGVQHHHAHVAGCMAEHGLTGTVIGIAFDGTGYGLDGKIWGGEFLLASPEGFERFAHLRYLPLPGGDQAAIEPWRLGVAYLEQALPAAEWIKELAFYQEINLQQWQLIKGMMAGGIATPDTSSMGRLFDAVAALLGLRKRVGYEGQAAIELEELAEGEVSQPYPFGLLIEGCTVVDPLPTIAAIADDLRIGVEPKMIARRFHGTVVEMACRVADMMRDQCAGVERVVLSGGVFQNRLLSMALSKRLEGAGFTVYQHRLVPANDGGLALGQVYVAWHQNL